MEDMNFIRLKELYHPVFSENPVDSQIAEAMRNADRLHLKAPVRNRVIELLSEYGRFYFTKTERISGDELVFHFFPLYFPYDLENNQDRAAFLGGYRNRSCGLYGNEETRYIESFYIDAAGFIRNQDHRLIAENITDFWAYIAEREYDYHPEITEDVMRIMRRAGRYEGRKNNIDALLEECMDDDVFPSDVQIAFIQEFGGLRGSARLEGLGFWFASARMRRCFQNIANSAKEQVWTLERSILRDYGADTLCVGYGNECDFPIFLTSDGQLILRDVKVGRTIWEGIQCILAY